MSDKTKCPECKSQICFAPRTSLRFCADCGWEGSYTQEQGSHLVAQEIREQNGEIDRRNAERWRKRKVEKA